MVLPTASAQGQQYNRPIVALLRNWTLLEARLEDFIGRDSGRAGGGMHAKPPSLVLIYSKMTFEGSNYCPLALVGVDSCLFSEL